MKVMHNVVNVYLMFVCFRAQFGQSRSFNSLSHKNLIMNMEPLVPALPSTNEYENTATGNGEISFSLHTHPCLPVEDLWKVTWCFPGIGRSTCSCTTLRHKALIEQLMLPSLHQSCLPGDTNGSMLKIPFPWSSLILPPCLSECVFVSLCPCVWLCVLQRKIHFMIWGKQIQLIITENSIRSYLFGSEPSDSVLVLYSSVHSFKHLFVHIPF